VARAFDHGHCASAVVAQQKSANAVKMMAGRIMSGSYRLRESDLQETARA
jgi:hypothetical protein